MGGDDQQTEPDLPVAYVAMHEAYRRLTSLERTHQRRQSIQAALVAEQERLEGLRSRLAVEQARLEAAESKAGRRLLPAGARRRREATAAWHRTVVDALRAELDVRQPAWEELSVSLGPAPGFDLVAELDAARVQLDDAVDVWQSMHREAGSAFSAWLHTSERYSGEIEALLEEVEEAAWLAGGATAPLERAPASSAAARFRGRLLELDTELRDLYRPTRAELAPPPSLRASLDDWFGGPLARWLAQGSLDLPLAAVADGRDQFDGLHAELWAYHRSLRRLLADVEQERLTRLLEHPGAV